MMTGFQQLQMRFTCYLREPGIDLDKAFATDRHCAIYRDLVFKNMNLLVSEIFPVTQSIVGADEWQLLIRDFIAVHRCNSPYAAEVGHEFLFYLLKERQSLPSDPPFLYQLAHFEWIQLVLHIADIELPARDTDTALSRDHCTEWAVSPLAIALTYAYAVDWIDQQYLPSNPQRTHLLAYRKRSDEVRITRADLLRFRIVQLLHEHGPMNCGQLVRYLSAELSCTAADAFDGLSPQGALARLSAVLAELADEDIALQIVSG